MTLPATPLYVKWELLSPAEFENLGSTMLSRMNPASIRTDGSGGDGGKDVHFDDVDGLVVYELKSFTGRVTTSRRTQVRNSFRRAQGLNPKRWIVVCPIDLTAKEREWFDGLTAKSGIDCSWLGTTWLDARMTEYPSVARYFQSDVNNELKELAELFAKEQAALTGGVPDAMERLRALQGKCDELDPFYRIDLSTTAAGVSATLTPRYSGAARDRPITMNARIAFPDSLDSPDILSALQDAFDFGRPVTVPASFVESVSVNAPAGLGGEFGAGEITIGPSEILDAPAFRLHMVVLDPKGKRVSSTPLTGKVTTAGRKGIIGEFHDESGLIAATLRVDFSAKELEFAFRYLPVPRTPRVMLPALKFLADCVAGNSIDLQLDDGRALGPPTVLTTTSAAGVRELIDAVELLGRLQEATMSYFDVPEVFTVENLNEMEVADRMLKGERVEGTWSRLTRAFPGAYADQIRQHLKESGNADGVYSLFEVTELVFELDSHPIPLGLVTTRLLSARTVDPEDTDQALAAAGPEDVVNVVFEPATTNECERWIGVPEGYPSATMTSAGQVRIASQRGRSLDAADNES